MSVGAVFCFLSCISTTNKERSTRHNEREHAHGRHAYVHTHTHTLVKRVLLRWHSVSRCRSLHSLCKNVDTDAFLLLLVGDMLEYGMNTMAMVNPNDPNQGFMNQLSDLSGMNANPSGGGGALPDANFDLNDLAAKNRNRGNYRCSKVA